MNRTTLQLALATTAMTLLPANGVLATEEVTLQAGSTVQSSFIGDDGIFSTGTLTGDERFFAQDLGPLGQSSALATEVADLATPAGLRFFSGTLETSASVPPAADSTDLLDTNFARGISLASGLGGSYTYVVQIFDLSVSGDDTMNDNAQAVLTLSSGGTDFLRGMTTSGPSTPEGGLSGTFSASSPVGWTFSAESTARSSENSALNKTASVEAQITVFEMGPGGTGCPTTGDPNEDCVIDATDLDIVGSLTRAIDMGNLSQSDLTPALEQDLDVGQDLGAGTGTPMLDDIPDGVVNGTDMDVLVKVVLNTAFGDANLDQMVDSSDLAILSANFDMPGGWATGDFNSDGFVNISDFAILAANFGFGVPPLQAAQTPAIPEPATLSLAAAALAVGLKSTRHRRAAV
ncbi:MAG: dockerin type I domain-containing protein [Planctomycetota bacterium]